MKKEKENNRFTQRQKQKKRKYKKLRKINIIKLQTLSLPSQMPNFS